MSERRTSLVRRIAPVLATALLVVAAFAAGRISISAFDDSASMIAEAVSPEAVWTVHSEQLGRTVNFVGSIEATTTNGPMANVDGVVTSVSVSTPQSVDVGTELYAVNLQPVYAGQGSVPSFRPLARGAQGADVAQLRAFLCDQDLLDACDPSDTFDLTLHRAVVAWQRTLKATPDGIVKPERILWFPELPVRLRPSPTLGAGEKIASADRPYSFDAGAPDLVLSVSRDQAALIPIGARAMVDGQAAATVADLVPASAETTSTAPAPATEQATGGQILVRLVGEGSDTPICQTAALCRDAVENQGSANVEVAISIIPDQEGPVVPVSAIRSDIDGTTVVVMADGSRRPITVLATAGGLSIVDGLSDGDTIRLPTPAG